MIYTIPLQPTAAQSMSCPIAGLQCQIWLRQLATGLYLDLTASTTPLLRGILCQNETDLIRNPACLLPGRLYFTDTQGHDDPIFSGLGSRFLLHYEDDTS
ncbi:hypothetical protein J3T99_07365 [Acetobacteraceae bacterium B3987]|nr:hypothetical protein [Acetobacteraceae bacterium B3987]